jgi:hypothetical protein
MQKSRATSVLETINLGYGALIVTAISVTALFVWLGW